MASTGGRRCWRWRRSRCRLFAALGLRQPGAWRICVLALAVIIFQAMLGMWTVTLLLKPMVVMGHLLGGMTTFALLAYAALRFAGVGASDERLADLRRLVVIGMRAAALPDRAGWLDLGQLRRARLRLRQRLVPAMPGPVGAAYRFPPGLRAVAGDRRELRRRRAGHGRAQRDPDRAPARCAGGVLLSRLAGASRGAARPAPVRHRASRWPCCARSCSASATCISACRWRWPPRTTAWRPCCCSPCWRRWRGRSSRQWRVGMCRPLVESTSECSRFANICS